MNKFDAYIAAIRVAQNVDDITRAICELGLFEDSRGLYGDEFSKYQIHGGGGAWQNPRELAIFLWDLRDEWKNVASFLDIGTFNAYTFFIILEFLKAHANSNVRACTCDPFDEIRDPSILPYVENYVLRGTVDDVPAGTTWDLVFIDGLHEAPGPEHDFEAVRKFEPKIVCFHDVVDKFCPDVVAFFRQKSSEFPSHIISEVNDVFGIGVLFTRFE